MNAYQLGDMEERFAQLLWQNAPISTRALTALCETAFSWKRTTTYTMLKRLEQRGLFENQQGTVVVRQSREVFLGAQGEAFLNERFEGSLPLFLAAFTKRQKLNASDIAQLQDLIDQYEEEEAP